MGELDLVVVGGGVVGLATAYHFLCRHPDGRLALVEKEPGLAAHQSGHNSGVVHSGIYYRPGSAKARTAVAGAALLGGFCEAHGIPLAIRGKVVVATEERELAALDELFRRGTENGVPGLALVGPERLREIEPHARGLRALHVPGTGVVDYRRVAQALADEIGRRGGEVRLGAGLRRVLADGDALVLETSTGALRARRMIACAGLQADRIARLEGARPSVRIVPFRGDFHRLRPERADLVRGLIYPVPDPRFPFLGVHFTRRVDGTVEAGPNAVLALDREGYSRASLRLRDAASAISFSGFWRLVARHFGTGLGEIRRSLSRAAFARALARLVPEVGPGDLEPAGCGIRAQALAPSGELVDDFLFLERPRALHVLNAPSPAATASLAIADEVVRRAERLFDLGPPRDGA